MDPNDIHARRTSTQNPFSVCNTVQSRCQPCRDRDAEKQERKRGKQRKREREQASHAAAAGAEAKRRRPDDGASERDAEPQVGAIV